MPMLVTYRKAVARVCLLVSFMGCLILPSGLYVRQDLRHERLSNNRAAKQHATDMPSDKDKERRAVIESRSAQ